MSNQLSNIATFNAESGTLRILYTQKKPFIEASATSLNGQSIQLWGSADAEGVSVYGERNKWGLYNSFSVDPANRSISIDTRTIQFHNDELFASIEQLLALVNTRFMNTAYFADHPHELGELNAKIAFLFQNRP